MLLRKLSTNPQGLKTRPALQNRPKGRPLQKPLLRGGAGLGALGAVFRTALLAVFHAGGVERAAHDVVTHSREILHTAAAHEHDGVLLEVVADARDVGGD